MTIKARSALPIWSRDPWLLSGAVAAVAGCPSAGELVDVLDTDGRWIGCGHFSPVSRIAVRLVSWRADEPVGDDFWRARLAAAFALRHGALGLGGDTDAYRLLHAEGDGVPGLVIDRLGAAVAVQAGTAGALALRPLVFEELRRELPGCAVIERHDREALAREGIDEVPAWVAPGEPPTLPDTITIREGGVQLLAAPLRGQKTGFYSDQRENRLRIGRMAAGRRVADLFTYTGGFALHAAAGGAASVVAVDSSKASCELGRGAAALLPATACRPTFEDADALEWTQARSQAGERFDLVIADPPALVKGRDHLKRGLARYRRIYQLAARLVAPGGLLALFSCSGLVSPDELESTVASALRESGRTGAVLARLGAGADHPFRPRSGGGEYLKGLLLHLLD